jgi:hypothetical protein
LAGQRGIFLSRRGDPVTNQNGAISRSVPDATPLNSEHGLESGATSSFTARRIDTLYDQAFEYP